VLSGATLFIIIAIVAVVLISMFAPEALIGLLGLVPAALGMAGYAVQKFTKSLRYSIAGTSDGIRVGFGLLSTSNETLPPGRIHSIKVSQPLLWRPFDWWEIKVNRAGHSSTNGAAGQQNTTLLPVGDRADVMRVLGLVLPDVVDREGMTLADHGLRSKGGDDGFVNSPRRAAPLRWFSWRRNGFAVTPGAVLLRKGAIWRELVVVPTPRVQSVSMSQGPLLRAIRLGAVQLHTVAGPITARLGAVDRDAAIHFFSDVSSAAVESSSADATHRWRTAEPGRHSAVTAPFAVAFDAASQTYRPATADPGSARPESPRLDGR
jgi:putative membrane protein